MNVIIGFISWLFFLIVMSFSETGDENNEPPNEETTNEGGEETDETPEWARELSSFRAYVDGRFRENEELRSYFDGRFTEIESRINELNTTDGTTEQSTVIIESTTTEEEVHQEDEKPANRHPWFRRIVG